MDCSAASNHRLNVIKTLAVCYGKVRLFHLGKVITEKIQGGKVRKQFSKLILFKNQ
jgi:hypothetical protein